MSGKQEDIGPKCYLYETLGKCIYGITCRFAKSHLGDGYKNVINQALVEQQSGKVLVKNSLDKELQQQLRKRKFLFEKSERYLKLMNKSRKDRNEGRKTGVKAETQGGAREDATSKGGDLSGCPNNATVGGAEGTTQEATRVTMGAITDEDIIKLRPCEKKTVRT